MTPRSLTELSKADMKFVNEQLRRNAYTKALDAAEAMPTETETAGSDMIEEVIYYI